MPISSLGIVTSSLVLITDKNTIENVPQLFETSEKEKTYILRENKTLEYNISTRRLNVIEPTVIDILPAGDMPTDNKNSLIDTVAPSLITGLGMVGIRILIKKFSDNVSFNDSMLAMTIAMPLMSAVNALYSRSRETKKFKNSKADWKAKYEAYINETIIEKKIIKWQKDEITYLNKVYPRIDILFNQVGEISPVLFERSQNDNDFMRVALGQSDEIKPSFEIKAEKKDDVFYDIYYKLHTPNANSGGCPYITIEMPEKKHGKFYYWFKKKDYRETTSDSKDKFLLTELTYNFATTQEKKNEDGTITTTGFKYLKDISKEGEKPPLLIDLRNMGTLGVEKAYTNSLFRYGQL
ncbi:MAG: hypothetical protein K2H19_02720 [Ruminococcus sp.]|nr:hypothetical protein [Ruminococcus sp.]